MSIGQAGVSKRLWAEASCRSGASECIYALRGGRISGRYLRTLAVKLALRPARDRGSVGARERECGRDAEIKECFKAMGVVEYVVNGQGEAMAVFCNATLM